MARSECCVPGCGRVMNSHGMCSSHISRKNSGADILAPFRRNRGAGSTIARDLEGKKECAKCLQWKAEVDYGKHTKQPDGLRMYCKKCSTRSVRVARIASVSRERFEGVSDKTLARYSKDREWFDETAALQGFKCAGCKSSRHPDKSWHIDHDHNCCPRAGSCGKCVRGLLCHPCNITLGFARDNPKTLENLAGYLRKE